MTNRTRPQYEATRLARWILTDVGCELRLARIFGDGMVMQRDAVIPVRGTATPGVDVVVTFDGTPYPARVDADGTWGAALSPRPAGGPYVMTVDAGDERLAVRDILVGDVWVASGQSNMEWTVADARDERRHRIEIGITVSREREAVERVAAAIDHHTTVSNRHRRAMDLNGVTQRRHMIAPPEVGCVVGNSNCRPQCDTRRIGRSISMWWCRHRRRH